MLFAKIQVLKKYDDMTQINAKGTFLCYREAGMLSFLDQHESTRPACPKLNTKYRENRTTNGRSGQGGEINRRMLYCRLSASESSLCMETS